MKKPVAGVIAGGALLVLMPLLPWPTSWPTFLVLALGAVFLERSGVTLDNDFRFSPAVPLYLACGMVSTVGCAAGSALLLMETVSRAGSRLLPALENRFPLVLGMVSMAATQFGFPEAWWLPLILGPSVYLLATLGLEYQTRKRLDRGERLRWVRARLQIRPLQFTLAASALAAWVLAEQQPWQPLLLLPALVATSRAAENIVLKAQEMSAEKVLSELDDARGQTRKAAQKLAEVQTEKQLMEGFSAHLARGPNIQDTAQSLVATVKKMVKADDVVVFLRDPQGEQPPEPFYYQAQDHHQARLQGLALTGLQEPIVDQCFEVKKLKTQVRAAPSIDRLFNKNRAGVALPMGELGVLYLGRAMEEPFPQAELKSLHWLADKARIGFEAAFRNQKEQQKSARQKRQMEELTKRIELMSSLIQSAEEMAATLQLEELAERLDGLLQRTFDHKEGFLIFSWDQERQVKRSWGSPHPPSDLSVLQAMEASGKALLVKDFSQSPHSPPTPGMASLICAPLTVQDRVCGALCLGAPETNHFSQEQLDKLTVIAYQAGMAFSNARLYTQVVEARRQLEESQQSLLQSRKMSAIGELAAGMAHELNTPLGVMSLSMESALEMLESNPNTARRMLEKALGSVERAQSITGRLLTYSRRPDHERENVDLEHLLKETVEFLAFDLTNSGIKPVLELQPIEVQGRPQELQQVLINLIRNGLHAMESRPLEERCLTLRVEPRGEIVAIEVCDTGDGISAEQQERIFEPFFTTKEVGKGTGLGLWVSLQIAEQHQGTLEVESEPGKGSTFRLLLPR